MVPTAVVPITPLTVELTGALSTIGVGAVYPSAASVVTHGVRSASTAVRAAAELPETSPETDEVARAVGEMRRQTIMTATTAAAVRDNDRLGATVNLWSLVQLRYQRDA